MLDNRLDFVIYNLRNLANIQFSNTEKDVNSGGSAASMATGWTGMATGWAASSLGSITSKIYKGKKGATPPPSSQSRSEYGDDVFISYCMRY